MFQRETKFKNKIEQTSAFSQSASVGFFKKVPNGFPNWQHHEYKAFSGEFKENEYKYIAFCESQVAVEIL